MASIGNDNLTLRQVVIAEIARQMRVSTEDITPDLDVSEVAGDVTVVLAYKLGKAFVVNQPMTVGDLIRQAETV